MIDTLESKLTKREDVLCVSGSLRNLSLLDRGGVLYRRKVVFIGGGDVQFQLVSI